MTIELNKVKSIESVKTNHSGDFATPPKAIYMDRWGGTGYFFPVSFKLSTDAFTNSKGATEVKYSLGVIATNDSGNPMIMKYEHPVLSRTTNFEGEVDTKPLAEAPDDILEAVSTLPGIDLVTVVAKLRAIASLTA